jgi:hypothetical protein
MRKVFLGTLMGWPVYVEVDDSCTEEEEQEMKVYMKDISEPIQKVDPKLAQLCGMKTVTILKPERKL